MSRYMLLMSFYCIGNVDSLFLNCTFHCEDRVLKCHENVELLILLHKSLCAYINRHIKFHEYVLPKF